MKFKILFLLALIFCLSLNAQSTPNAFNNRGLHVTNKYYVDGNIVNPSNATYQRFLEDEPVGIMESCVKTIALDSIYVKPDGSVVNFCAPTIITGGLPGQYGDVDCGTICVHSDTKVYDKSPIEIKGIVLDSESIEAIPFANIVLKQKDETVRGVPSDFDANFLITAPDEGAYTIEVSYVGYETQVIELDLKENIDKLVVELKPQETCVFFCGAISECYAPYTNEQLIQQQLIDESLFEDENAKIGKLVYGKLEHKISIHQLPYVFVVIKETGQKARVDYNGMYRIEDVEEGEYTIEVYIEGRLLKQTQLLVNHQDKIKLNIRL